MKLYTSEGYMIEATYFMQNYFEITYNKKGKPTHKQMNEFLMKKIGKGAKRLRINSISKEDILTGRVLLVRGSEGKVVPYKNPRGNLSALEEELKRNCSLEKLRSIRVQLLSEQEDYSNQKSYQKKKKEKVKW